MKVSDFHTGFLVGAAFALSPFILGGLLALIVDRIETYVETERPEQQ